MGVVHTPGPGRPMPLPAKTRRWLARRMLLRLGAALVLVAIAGWFIRVPRVVWANGNVISEEYAEIRPAVAGTVQSIAAHSGDQVRRGDLLVQLDNAEALATLEEARRQMHKAEAELTRREAEVAEQKRRRAEDMAVVDLRLQNARSRLARIKELLSRGLVAGSALEDEQLKVDLIQAELESLRQQDMSVYDKELAVVREELAARREAVTRAEAAAQARAIRAPIDGQVLRYEFVTGEMVRPDVVLMEIFGGEGQVLKLRIPERHAARVKAGDPYRARLASYGGLRDIWFRGEVQHLRNVIQYEGASGYRVAYCSFDPQGRGVPPGATAEARVYCGRTRLWLFLLGLE